MAPPTPPQGRFAHPVSQQRSPGYPTPQSLAFVSDPDEPQSPQSDRSDQFYECDASDKEVLGLVSDNTDDPESSQVAAGNNRVVLSDEADSFQSDAEQVEGNELEGLDDEDETEEHVVSEAEETLSDQQEEEEVNGMEESEGERREEEDLQGEFAEENEEDYDGYGQSEEEEVHGNDDILEVGDREERNIDVESEDENEGEEAESRSNSDVEEHEEEHETFVEVDESFQTESENEFVSAGEQSSEGQQKSNEDDAVEDSFVSFSQDHMDDSHQRDGGEEEREYKDEDDEEEEEVIKDDYKEERQDERQEEEEEDSEDDDEEKNSAHPAELGDILSDDFENPTPQETTPSPGIVSFFSLTAIILLLFTIDYQQISPKPYPFQEGDSTFTATTILLWVCWEVHTQIILMDRNLSKLISIGSLSDTCLAPATHKGATINDLMADIQEVNGSYCDIVHKKEVLSDERREETEEVNEEEREDVPEVRHEESNDDYKEDKEDEVERTKEDDSDDDIVRRSKIAVIALSDDGSIKDSESDGVSSDEENVVRVRRVVHLSSDDDGGREARTILPHYSISYHMLIITSSCRNH